jgi:hypothetical protein
LLVVSGILEEQAAEVEAVLLEKGFMPPSDPLELAFLYGYSYKKN